MDPVAFEKWQNELVLKRRGFAFKAGPLLIISGCLLGAAGRVFLWKNDAGFDPSSGVSQSSALTYVWVPIVFLAIGLMLGITVAAANGYVKKWLLITLIILCLVALLVMIPYTLFVEVNEGYTEYPEYNPAIIPGFLWLHAAVFMFSAYLCPLLMLAGTIIMVTALRRKKQVSPVYLPGYPVPHDPYLYRPLGRSEG